MASQLSRMRRVHACHLFSRSRSRSRSRASCRFGLRVSHRISVRRRIAFTDGTFPPHILRLAMCGKAVVMPATPPPARRALSVLYG
jgi:hypothetical protein